MSTYHIKEISRSEVDNARWNRIVDHYGDGRPYAYTWYLDALTQGKWKAIVIGDYDSILPLPFHRKWIYQIRVYQPFLSQCFGPIGKLIDQDILLELVEYISTQYPNSHLMFPQIARINNVVKSVEQRSFQWVDISSDIASIRAKYGKNRRREIRQYKDQVEIELNTDVEKFLHNYRRAKFPTTKPILKQWSMFNRLLEACRQHDSLQIITLNKEEEFLTTAACLITDTRVISLIGATSEIGKSFAANAIRLDAMIEHYCGEKKVFDFFGSTMPGVRKFNLQFGAIEDEYTMIYT